MRRALAVQMVINQEWGLAKNENPNQGSFIIKELTDLVEEAVLKEFESIADRGGVLGAMETGYQRSRIQEESLHYETLKHTGEYPIIGVNTFINPEVEKKVIPQLQRSTEEEKISQINRLRSFHDLHKAQSEPMLKRLKQASTNGENIFNVSVNGISGVITIPPGFYVGSTLAEEQNRGSWKHRNRSVATDRDTQYHRVLWLSFWRRS